MSRRFDIHTAYLALLNKELDGVNYSNIYNNVKRHLEFWDTVTSYPAGFVVLGDELRQYEGGIKWGYLQMSVRIYTKSEEFAEDLDQFLEDIENIIDNNTPLIYDEKGNSIIESTVQNITTDGGVLNPLAVGEINYVLRYSLPYVACCNTEVGQPYPCP
jgi:hypothetical protein